MSTHSHIRPFKRKRLVFFAPFAFLVTLSSAVLFNFENCLNTSTVNSVPKQLQWVPLYLDARLDPDHNLNITIYGNVTGNTVQTRLPPANDPYWTNPNDTYGKIANEYSAPNKRSNFSTLYYDFKVLTYVPYEAPYSPFCDSTLEGTTCPIAPVFNQDPSPDQLRAFTIGRNMNSSYKFATIDATAYIYSGLSDAQGPVVIGCISSNITPDLGSTLKNLLRYLPVAILVIVACSTVLAAMFSPWGTSDPLKWTSNYGRDEDLLRLVTPGFGDCLQYIQFIVLSGSLTLLYPGYFQPVVSRVGWSALMFNESFVSHDSGRPSVVDGIYVANGTYGLDKMGQLIGMSSSQDIWAGMVIWALVIIGLVVVACQAAFLSKWAARQISNEPAQDLRNKNWPFTGGNFVRVVCIFFLLPIVSLSMFQLVIAGRSPAYVTALAAILLAALLAFAALLLRVIFKANPRSHLFDDLPTVLLYGPLYNTYSDEAAPFALIPALLTFIRGIAIGAVQPSGIAQLVMLAICEVVLLLTVWAFRPFRSQTSMNAYHTFFASIRLAVILLMVAFVPSLGVTEAPKGWIGYAILLLHAVVLVFGFLLNSVQTLLEVFARMSGAGADNTTGAATRGGLTKVFGVRQLSRRQRRTGFRNSMNSDAAILTDDGDAMDTKSAHFDRSRSLSASSAILLNQRTPDQMSMHLDRFDSANADIEGFPEYGAYTPLSDAYAAGSSRRPNLAVRTSEAGAPYYRAPRQRRATGDLVSPIADGRTSVSSGDWMKKAHEGASPQDATSRPMSFSPDNKLPRTYSRNRLGSDAMLNDRRPSVDYAVREVDFYYGVRGPALSNMPTRKLKTGPADPVGPVSSAQGWFRGFLGRKTKDQGKGFEVVRSSRAAPRALAGQNTSPEQVEPYEDDPEPSSGPSTEFTDASGMPSNNPRSRTPLQTMRDPRRNRDEEAPSPINSEDEAFANEAASRPSRISETAPALAPIDVGGFELPSRMGSRISRAEVEPSSAISKSSVPTLPYKSSRRQSQTEFDMFDFGTEAGPSSGHVDQSSYTDRIPFDGSLSREEGSQASRSAQPLSLPTFDTARTSTETDVAYGRRSSNATTLIAGSDLGRPTSYGHVNQHRASDSITPGSSAITTHQGSSAEVVNSTLAAEDSVGVSRNRSAATDKSVPYGW